MEKIFTEEDILELLDKVYAQVIEGLSDKSPSIEILVNDYLSKNDSIEKAAEQFVNYQVAKCATSGFVTGLGGLITLPVAIPANIGSVLYVQMRMIAGLAYIGGYDVKSDQVQTLVYVCLAGISIEQFAKAAGIKIGEKLALAMVEKIPGATLKAINQKVGFRLLTKFGEKGVINLGKAVPIVGGVVSAGFDTVETKVIANRAKKLFIQGDMSVITAKEEIIDIK